MFPNSIHDQGREYSNLNEFSNSIPSFNESHDVKSTLLWTEEVDNLFGMDYIPMEDYVKFMAHKLKGRTVTWCNRFQNMHMYQGKPPIRT